jgi:hypothetical protein
MYIFARVVNSPHDENRKYISYDVFWEDKSGLIYICECSYKKIAREITKALNLSQCNIIKIKGAK